MNSSIVFLGLYLNRSQPLFFWDIQEQRSFLLLIPKSNLISENVEIKWIDKTVLGSLDQQVWGSILWHIWPHLIQYLGYLNLFCFYNQMSAISRKHLFDLNLKYSDCNYNDINLTGRISSNKKFSFLTLFKAALLNLKFLSGLQC